MCEGLVSKELSLQAIVGGGRDFYKSNVTKATTTDPSFTDVFKLFEGKQQSLGFKNSKRSFEEATSTDFSPTLSRKQLKAKQRKERRKAARNGNKGDTRAGLAEAHDIDKDVWAKWVACSKSGAPRKVENFCFRAVLKGKAGKCRKPVCSYNHCCPFCGNSVDKKHHWPWNCPAYTGTQSFYTRLYVFSVISPFPETFYPLFSDYGGS